MLKHLNDKVAHAFRVVVLGSNGFVGSHIVRQLKKEGVETLALSRKEVNLLSLDADTQLLNVVKENDVLVIVSALAPCKNNEMLMDNLRMIQSACKVIEKVAFSQIVYISSDAVYADDVTLASESSNASPSSFHGMMHLARELMLKNSVKKTPLAILRATLLYGLEDPHNGYGPNRFRRLADKNEKIVLFGNGEEKRDHVFIEDVAKIVSLAIAHRSEGMLNIATGESHSFRETAEEAVSVLQATSIIEATPRQNPITHRHFDISDCQKAFPTFHYVSFKDGFKQVVQKQKATAEVA
jgi:UDP-glucose 4-epimerase